MIPLYWAFRNTELSNMLNNETYVNNASKFFQHSWHQLAGTFFLFFFLVIFLPGTIRRNIYKGKKVEASKWLEMPIFRPSPPSPLSRHPFSSTLFENVERRRRKGGFSWRNKGHKEKLRARKGGKSVREPRRVVLLFRADEFSRDFVVNLRYFGLCYCSDRGKRGRGVESGEWGGGKRRGGKWKSGRRANRSAVVVKGYEEGVSFLQVT